jgi:hypothetical protein
MTIRSVWHINNDQTREDTRLAPIGTMTSGTSALSTWNGVIPTAGNPMNLTSTGSMSAQIEIGRAVVQGLDSQGCYPVVITAPEPVGFSDGDSQARIDSVCIVVRDDLYDTSSETSVIIELVRGVAGTNPAPPELPTASSLRLWNVTVRAGVSAGGGGIDWDSDVEDVRDYTVAVGGISVGTTTFGAYAGQWRDSGGASGSLSRFNGSVWDSTFRVESSGALAIGDVEFQRGGSNLIVTPNVFKPAVEETTTTSMFTPNSGWTVTFLNFRRTSNVVTLNWSLTRNGQINAVVLAPDSGDHPDTAGVTLADQQLGTVNSAWRDGITTQAIVGSGDNGDAVFGLVMGPDGIVSLRSTSATIKDNSTVRIQFTFIQKP